MTRSEGKLQETGSPHLFYLLNSNIYQVSRQSAQCVMHKIKLWFFTPIVLWLATQISILYYSSWRLCLRTTTFQCTPCILRKSWLFRRMHAKMSSVDYGTCSVWKILEICSHITNGRSSFCILFHLSYGLHVLFHSYNKIWIMRVNSIHLVLTMCLVLYIHQLT